MIRDADKDGRIKEAVTVADSMIRGFFPGDEKAIKQMLVQFVIFPFCKQWLGSDVDGYTKAKTSL